jgi:RNA polymerase sigma-70 factor, ECF subfamily
MESPTTDSTERLLVQQCLAGDQRAWGLFFDSHYRMISSIAAWKKWGFDHAEREDVTQEILEGVVKSLRSFEFKSRVSTFVYRIAVSSCIATLRKRTAGKRRAESGCVPLEMWDGEASSEAAGECSTPLANPEKLLMQRESISAVRQALALLGQACQDLIHLRYFDELSFSDIAAQTGTKENTLVVRLRRCLTRLLEHLQAGA